MTLLKRYIAGKEVSYEEICRALAIAQAVEESASEIAFDTEFIMRRADELLRGDKP